MELLDLGGGLRFAPDEHVQSFLAETPLCAVSVVGWEPGQAGRIHCHPGADEVYHVLSGEGLFTDGRDELRLGPGATVLFGAGEVHRVESVTRLVLYQAGAERAPAFDDDWP